MENDNNITQPPVEVKSISTPPTEPTIIEPTPANLNPNPEPAPAESTPAAPVPNLEPTPPTPTPTPTPTPPPPPPTETANATIQENFKPPRTFKHFFKVFGLAFLIALALFILTAVAAETGFVNSGIDKLYGRTKLAALWGGIPANNELALTLLASKPAKTPKNISGTLNLSAEGEYTYTPYTPPTIIQDDLGSETTTEQIRFNSFPKVNNQPFALQNYNLLTQAQSTQTQNDLSIEEPITAEPITYPINTQLALEFASLNDYEQFKLNIGLTDEGFLKEFGVTDIATEIILKDKTVYIKIPQNIPLELASVYGLDSSYIGKYFKFQIPDDQWQSFQESYKNPESADVVSGLSEEELTAAIKLIANYIDRVGIERVNGHSAVHYKIEMDAAKIVSFIKEIEALTIKTSTIDQDVSNKYFEELEKSLGTTSLTYDFWIEYKTYLTVKTDFHIDVNSETFTLNGDLSSTTQSISADSLTINAPSESDIIDANTNLEQSRSQARDAVRKSDLKQIGSLLEIYSAQKKSYPVSTEPISLDQAALLSDVYSATDLIQINGPNGIDDDYYYQTNADGSAYLLTATLEACDSDCSYSYPENSSLLAAETQTQTKTTLDLNKTKDRDQKRKDDLSAIGDALTIYQRENSKYPVASKLIKLSDKNNVVETEIKGILNPLPTDPTADKFYYGYSSNGNSVVLTAVMEDADEVNCTVSGNYCVYQYKLGN